MSWPTVNAGEACTLRVPNVRDADTGGLLNLAAATVMEFQARRQPREPGQADDDADNPVVLSKSLAGGGISYDGDGNENALIALEAADTNDLAGWYYADFWITIAGDRRPVVAAERWQIKQSVNGA